jgi:transposase
MKYYIGLDVSMKTTSICIVDQHGSVVFEETVSTDPIAISNAISSTRLKIEKTAVESGSISHWLVQELCKKGLPIICIDSRKMSKVLSININKTDKNDARLIADALRCGFYSEVHQKSQENVETRILINSRRTLKNISSTLKNTIRGHLKAFGIRLGPAKNNKFIELVEKLLKDKSEIVQYGLQQLLEAFSSINQKLLQIEQKLEELAKHDEDIQLLKTIPGVGLLTAFTFKVYLGDPKRFKSSRSVGAYFGLTPTQYSSGETQRQGRVSKRGSSEIRFLLNEAAAVMLYRTKSWCRPKAWGLKLKKKKGHKKATTAIGRKLCTIMHRILITRKSFEYGEPKEKESQSMKKAS